MDTENFFKSKSHVSASEMFEKAQYHLRAWLKESGGARLDVYCDGLGPSVMTTFWTIVDHERKSVHADQSSISAVSDLRGAQALPGRGAWFYSHLWMELPEGVLHQESDWMCEPDVGTGGFYIGRDGLDIRGGGPDLGDYKTELDRYPRDQEFIPDWLRVKVEQWRQERSHVVARRMADLEEAYQAVKQELRLCHP